MMEYEAAQVAQQIIIKLQRQDRILAAKERRAKALVINQVKKYGKEAKQDN